MKRPMEAELKPRTTIRQFLAATQDGRRMIWCGKIFFGGQSARTPDHLQFPATHFILLTDLPPLPPDSVQPES